MPEAGRPTRISGDYPCHHPQNEVPHRWGPKPGPGAARTRLSSTPSSRQIRETLAVHPSRSTVIRNRSPRRAEADRVRAPRGAVAVLTERHSPQSRGCLPRRNGRAIRTLELDPCVCCRFRSSTTSVTVGRTCQLRVPPCVPPVRAHWIPVRSDSRQPSPRSPGSFFRPRNSNPRTPHPLGRSFSVTEGYSADEQSAAGSAGARASSRLSRYTPVLRTHAFAVKRRPPTGQVFGRDPPSRTQIPRTAESLLENPLRAGVDENNPPASFVELRPHRVRSGCPA